jgi:hypothetical protein
VDTLFTVGRDQQRLQARRSLSVAAPAFSANECAFFPGSVIRAIDVPI